MSENAAGMNVSEAQSRRIPNNTDFDKYVEALRVIQEVATERLGLAVYEQEQRREGNI